MTPTAPLRSLLDHLFVKYPVPETSGTSQLIRSDGRGVTVVFERYINFDQLDSSLIENTLLNELNAIFRPDADYSRLLVQQLGTNAWEIHLEEPRKGRIPISHTGSGLKTVLLVLANLLVVPQQSPKPDPLSKYIFAFEELENNLHPAIQRRLFLYLRKKAIEEKCHFFITTHSNVVIDLFSGDEHAQILHVTHDGETASVNVVETSAHGHRVLDDLDVRASDLLQTNAVVWVEGPSDRFYFVKWIELWSEGKLVEGVHYQCLPYGGSCNAHFSFDSPEMVEELIPALKINRNAILLADSDKHADQDELKHTPKRLAEEVTKVGGLAWITQGKEVENYIPVATFQAIYDKSTLKGPSQYSDVFDYVAKQDGKAKPTKTALAHRVMPRLTKDALADTLDMADQLNKVCELIRKWNRIAFTVE